MKTDALHRLVRGVPTRLAGAGVLTLALAAGFAGGRSTVDAATAVEAPAPQTAEPRTSPPATYSGPTSYSAIVERVSPAVVTVRVEREVEASRTNLPDGLREFFGDQFGEQFRFEVPQGRQSGVGSGVIVRADGYILTNNHVVADAGRIRVDMTDGRSFTATVVGTDPASDLAVIKVNATGLPTVPYGDSEKVKVGDVVLAVGNPLGIGQTVTMGIVSAKGRTTPGPGDGSYEDFLQTDAPINRGNSGGALVDVHGNLVGINAQILSPSGGNIGLGFAIPSSMARSVADQLIDGGVVRRAKLGVNVQPVTSDLAEGLGLEHVRGALVSGVEPGSPADKAGLKQQDVITSFNGRAVVDANALRNQVASTRPGTSVEIKVLRDGRPQTLTATVVERDPQTASASRRGSQGDPARAESQFGMTVGPLTPQVRRQMDLPTDVAGVVVNDVDPNGAAASAGVRPGDVIKRVNGKDVTSPSELRSALNAQTGRPALVLVAREGGDLFLALPSTKS